jgi:hypothetical protein
MRASSIPPTAPHRLIVEGVDDKWSVINLLAQHGCDWQLPTPGLPYIDAAGSDDAALKALPTTIKSYSRVGIVLDADLSAPSRWQAVAAKHLCAGSQPPLCAASRRTGPVVDRLEAHRRVAHAGQSERGQT